MAHLGDKMGSVTSQDSSTDQAQLSRLRAVADAMREWRGQLMSLDGNNRLLYYRDLKVGTLNLERADEEFVERLLTGEGVRLNQLFKDEVDLSASIKSIKNIAGKARESEEEYGVPIGYLASGMATWDDGRTPPAGTDESADDEAVSTPRSTTLRSPVLLRQIEFAALPGSQEGFEISVVGEEFLNPVLLHALKSFFGLAIDDENFLEGVDSDQEAFQALAELAKEINGFEVRPERVIGTFSYLKQPMVDDLDEDLVAFYAANDMIAAIAGVREAREALREQGGEVRDTDPDHEPPTNEFLILDADASQSYVINAVAKGQSLVIQGPPGTGKSQSIANMVADLVARGKTVLFVAQKRAAITAVLHRLELCGLEHLALDLFSGGGQRKAVIQSLKEGLEGTRETQGTNAAALYERWTSARSHLIEHRDALHQVRSPWGASLWGLMLEDRAVRGRARSSIRISSAVANRWGELDRDSLSNSAAELSAAGGLDAELFEGPRWRLDALATLEIANEALQLLETARDHLASLRNVLASIEDATSLQLMHAPFGEISELFAMTAEVLGKVPQAFAAEFTDLHLQQAQHATASREWRRNHVANQDFAHRRAGVRIAKSFLGKSVERSTRFETIEAVQRARASWASFGDFCDIDRVRDEVLRGAEAFASFDQRLSRVLPYVSDVDVRITSFGALDACLGSIARSAYRLRMPRITALRQQLKDNGLYEVLNEMSRDHLDVEESAGRVRQVMASSLIDNILSTDIRLAGVALEQLQLWAREFSENDDRHLKLNAERVRWNWKTGMASARTDNPREDEVIRRQVIRRRGYASIRELFAQAPHLVSAIKPCWAMSPLMVSQNLPNQQLFDVVIFDEASQVVPAEAIPALARAKQFVIAGDSRQLPPTTVGQRRYELDDDADDSSDDLEVEIEAPATRNAESILETVDQIVLEGRSKSLLWHYRSKDEHLIATNNRYIYHNRMITFPGVDGVDRVRFEAVPPSRGIGPHNKSPEAEVSRVVDLALEHAQKYPDESLGVIAFGQSHAKRIEAALDARLRSEPALQSFFQEGGSEPFFIKNIERVQGDEREAIILSIGYGRSNDGRLRYMWGPLLTSGGERRINVATSRARSRMTLVSSIRPEDLDPTANKSEGYQYLYRFINFMASAGETFGNNPGRDVTMNSFESDIYERLTARGLSLEPQWGVGQYLLDFAVRDPEHPGRFIMAIECDGARYHSGVIARERDRLRQQHLERLGWYFHRIWSTDWFQDPGPQIDQVLAAYEVALARARLHDGEKVEAEVIAPSLQPDVKIVERGPAPAIEQGLPIGSYNSRQLVALVRWIMSDEKVRSADELLNEAMSVLGYRRRGSNIVKALRQAIAKATRPTA